MAEELGNFVVNSFEFTIEGTDVLSVKGRSACHHHVEYDFNSSYVEQLVSSKSDMLCKQEEAGMGLT